MVLTSTHNLCFEKKYEKYQNFLSEKFPFLVVKFSIYLNRRIFVIIIIIIISSSSSSISIVVVGGGGVHYVHIQIRSS